MCGIAAIFTVSSTQNTIQKAQTIEQYITDLTRVKGRDGTNVYSNVFKLKPDEYPCSLTAVDASADIDNGNTYVCSASYVFSRLKPETEPTYDVLMPINIVHGNCRHTFIMNGITKEIGDKRKVDTHDLFVRIIDKCKDYLTEFYSLITCSTKHTSILAKAHDTIELNKVLRSIEHITKNVMDKYCVSYSFIWAITNEKCKRCYWIIGSNFLELYIGLDRDYLFVTNVKPYDYNSYSIAPGMFMAFEPSHVVFSIKRLYQKGKVDPEHFVFKRLLHGLGVTNRKPTKVFVLHSGGLDSTVTLKLYTLLNIKNDKPKFTLHSVSVDYGQPAYNAERKQSYDFVKKLNRCIKDPKFYIEHFVTRFSYDVGNLVDAGKDKDKAKNESRGIGAYVPHRNTRFVLDFIDTLESKPDDIGLPGKDYNMVISLGLNQSDGMNYPDNSHRFIKAINTLVKVSGKAEHTSIHVTAPLINYNKAEILLLNLYLDLLLEEFTQGRYTAIKTHFARHNNLHTVKIVRFNPCYKEKRCEFPIEWFREGKYNRRAIILPDIEQNLTLTDILDYNKQYRICGSCINFYLAYKDYVKILVDEKNVIDRIKELIQYLDRTGIDNNSVIVNNLVRYVDNVAEEINKFAEFVRSMFS